MKKIYFSLVVLFTTLSGAANAQCALSGSYFGEMIPNNGCANFSSYGPYGPGMYFRMPVLLGASYSISTCGAGVDTQLTGYQGTSPQVFFAEDNGPICSGTAASVTYVPTFTDYMRVQVSQYNCLAGGSASITVQVRQDNNLMFTSSAADMCAGETRALTATPASVASAQPNSGDLGTFTGTGVSGTTFTAPTPAGASATYTLTYTFGFCSTTQNITVYSPPSTADAGPDQPEICGTSSTLQASAPAIGTGTWSVSSGTATITNPNDPVSAVTGLVPGTSVTLTWTVANGPCLTSADDVVLNVGDITAPVPDLASLADVSDECEVAALTAPTATDNCSGALTATPDVSLPINTQGTTVVTWTYDDGNGNTTTQTQNVVIADVTAPVADVAVLNDIVSCTEVTPTTPAATDNCVGALSGTPDVSFPITTSTVITWTYDDGNGNTSTQTQNVVINSADVSVTQTGTTLTANSSAGMFQWLDCDNGYQLIAGETGASFTPTTISGNYAVQVTEAGCVDTSACYLVDYTGVQEMVAGIDVSIYPNPSEGKFNVELKGLDGNSVELRIVDLQGRVVLSEVIENASGNHVSHIDISKNEAGIYVIDVKGAEGQLISSQRIVKR